jgi:hypothetical protein
MERELVSEEELLSILNKEFSKYEECENCKFAGVVKLAEADKDGCNWSLANVSVRCSGVPEKKCHPFAVSVVAEAGKRYNIK